jgi:hypothetical protein
MSNRNIKIIMFLGSKVPPRPGLGIALLFVLLFVNIESK